MPKHEMIERLMKTLTDRTNELENPPPFGTICMSADDLQAEIKAFADDLEEEISLDWKEELEAVLDTRDSGV